MAWPTCTRSSWTNGSGAPAATSSWSRTRSRSVRSPVPRSRTRTTCSVTGCSTWRRVLTSRKAKQSRGSTRSPARRRASADSSATNSTVPAFTYPMARAAATAASQRAARTAVVDRRGGRLLDDLLVAPLDGALPLEGVDDGAVDVSEDLHLEVAGTLHEPFEEDGVVTERRGGLPAGGGDGVLELVRTRDEAHALAATAGGGLHQQREADLLAQDRDVGAGRQLGAGYERHAGVGHAALGLDLVAHRGDRVRRRPDPGEAGGHDRPSEAGVLRQEPVAGVHRVRPGPGSGVEQRVDTEVGVGEGVAPPSRIASSQTRTWSASASTSEKTATVAIPIDRQVRATRTAISPRLAISTLPRQLRWSRHSPAALTSGTPRSRSLPATGAPWTADSARPSTSRVSRGSMTPSSQPCPVENSAFDSASIWVSTISPDRSASCASSYGSPRFSAADRATIDSTPASCCGPMTAMWWFGHANRNRGS